MILPIPVSGATPPRQESEDTLIQGSSKYYIYPSHVIQKLWNEYLGSTVQHLFTKEEHILKRTNVNFSMHTISWAENHSKCITDIR